MGRRRQSIARDFANVKTHLRDIKGFSNLTTDDSVSGLPRAALEMFWQHKGLPERTAKLEEDLARAVLGDVISD